MFSKSFRYPTIGMPDKLFNSPLGAFFIVPMVGTIGNKGKAEGLSPPIQTANFGSPFSFERGNTVFLHEGAAQFRCKAKAFLPVRFLASSPRPVLGSACYGD